MLPSDAHKQWKNKVKLSVCGYLNLVIVLKGLEMAVRDVTLSLPSWLSLLTNSTNYVIIYFYFLFLFYVLRAKVCSLFHLNLLPFWFWPSASFLVFSIAPCIGGGHSLSHTSAVLVHDPPPVVEILLPPHLTSCNNIILVWHRHVGLCWNFGC